MDNENNELKGFMFPVDHLRSLVEQIEKGIEPMMSDLERMEVKKYYNLMNSELFGDDDDGPLDADEEARHQELMRKALEEKKRKAHREDVVAYIKLSESQRKQLEEEMSSSLVRPNPNSVYNKSDEELYGVAEKRVIFQKLSRLRNCYYTQPEWVAAMEVIREAIDISLRHDYMFLGGYQKALQAYNDGLIRFTFCPIPKLYINHITPIRDPELLKGVLNGDVQVVERMSEVDVPKKSYKNSELIPYHAPVIGEAEHAYYAEMHKRGFDTPESPVIRAKSTIYDRYVIPDSNKKKTGFGIVDETGTPIIFDWLGEGPMEYFRRLHGYRTTVDDIIENVQKANGRKINKVLGENLDKVLRAMQNGGKIEEKPGWLSSSLQVSPAVVKMEQDLIRAIQLNNPTK